MGRIIKKIDICIITILMLIMSVDNLSNEFIKIGNFKIILYILVCVIYLIVKIVYEKGNIIVIGKASYIYLTLFLSIAVNLLFVQELSSSIGFIFFGVFNSIVLLNIINDIKEAFTISVLKSAIIASSIYVVASIIFHPPLKTIANSYYGVFNNSNVFAMHCMILSIMIITALEKCKKKRLICWIIVGVNLFLINLSNSRTSLIIVIYGICHYFIKEYNIFFKLNKKKVLFVLLTLIAIITSFYWFDYSSIKENKIIQKVTSSIESGDISSGRFTMWQESIKDVKFLGNGERYFHERYNGLSAHNSYVSILVCNGVIPFILYITMIIISYIYIVKNKKELMIIFNSLVMIQFTEITFGKIGSLNNFIFIMIIFYALSLKNNLGNENVRLKYGRK